MKKVTQKQFIETIKNNEKVVVVLTKSNCSACKILKENLLPKIDSDLPFVELEAQLDAYPTNELSEKFGFRSVPAVVLYRNGQPVKAVNNDFSELPKLINEL